MKITLYNNILIFIIIIFLTKSLLIVQVVQINALNVLQKLLTVPNVKLSKIDLIFQHAIAKMVYSIMAQTMSAKSAISIANYAKVNFYVLNVQEIELDLIMETAYVLKTLQICHI